MKKNKLIILSTLMSVCLISGCGASTGDIGMSQQNMADGAPSVKSDAGMGINAYSTQSTGSASAYEESAAEVTFDYDYDYEGNPSEQASTTTVNDAEITLAEEKLVYTCYISIETTEYEQTIQSINALIEQYGGIVQSIAEYDDAYDWYYSEYAKSRGTLSCTMQIRVPSSNYKAITESLGDVGKVRSKNSSVDNISQKYYDTEIQIKSLEKEEERLLQMMDNAYGIEDMISIESRLSEVDSQLMQLKTDIKYMDMDVAYSYINLDVNEVVEYSEDDPPIKTNKFIDRLYNQLVNTWESLLNNLENLLFLIIALLPYIVIIVVIIFVYKKLLKNKVKAIKEKRKARRIESGDLSLKDMGKMINDLNSKINDIDKKDE